MKFDPTYSRSRSRLGLAVGIMAATCLFAVERSTPTAAGASDGGDPEVDETSQDTGGAGGTATGTGTGTQTKAKAATETKAEANTELATLIKTYDEVKAKAESYMCDIAEFINKNNLGRPVVIATLMEARGLTLESAASNASRLMKLAKNPDLIKSLRDGTATIRETVYGKAPSSNAKAGSEGDTSAKNTAKKSDSEKKEDKYNRLVGELVAAAKECGFSSKDVLAGFTAALKDAGVK